MKKFFYVLSMCILGCGSPNHAQERAEACDHIEGFQDDECNAGDDFSSLTCEIALEQFQSWWRSDIQTLVNQCVANFACHTDISGKTGPSIAVALDTCMDNILLSGLKATGAQNITVDKICHKFSACGYLGSYTILNCKAELLSPYGDGKIMLVMNDEIASRIVSCDSSTCINFIFCIQSVLIEANVFSTMNSMVMSSLNE